MQALQDLFGVLWREVSVFVLAAVPGVELRVALPAGVVAGMRPAEAFVVSYLGSMLPAWPILLWIKPLLAKLRQSKWFRNIADWIQNRALRKSLYVRRYSVIGLALFVAIPLPATGVWTGAIIASLLNMRSMRAFTALAVGNAIAGAILMLLSGLIA